MFFHVFTSHGQIASLECYSIFRLSCAIISSTHENLKCLGKSWFAFSFKTQFFCRLRDLQNLFLLDPRLLNAILHIWKQFFFSQKNVGEYTCGCWTSVLTTLSLYSMNEKILIFAVSYLSIAVPVLKSSMQKQRYMYPELRREYIQL